MLTLICLIMISRYRIENEGTVFTFIVCGTIDIIFALTIVLCAERVIKSIFL